MIFFAAASGGLVGTGPARAQDPSAENADITRIETFWQAGNRQAAHAAIDSLLPLARLETDSTLICRLLVMRGLMHTAMGDGPKGESPLREGLNLARATGSVSQELTALRWLGVALGQNLKDDEARQAFVELRALAAAHGDPTREAWAEVGLAYQSRRRGQIEAARTSYERSVSLFREAGQVRGEIFALNGLGNVLIRQNDFGAARRCYEQTLAVSREIKDPFMEALAELNLGTLEFSLGDPGLALAHFRRSHEIDMKENNLREAVKAAHNIAICLTYLGEYDRSLALLDESLRICREREYRELEHSTLSQKGLVLTEQKQIARALAIYEELLAWPESMPAERTVELYLGYALALDRMGRFSESAAFLLTHEAEARVFDGPLLRLFYTAQLGTSLGKTGRPRAALVRLLAVDAEAEPMQFNAPRLAALPAAGAAYLALDRPDSAMICYRQAAAIWEYERRMPMDPEWRERRGIAGQAIFTELAGLVLKRESGATKESGIRRAYELLQVYKARTLLERMMGPGSEQLVYPAPVNLDQLQSALRADGEVFLDFFVGYNRSFLFAVTRDTIRVRELPPAKDLAAQVDLFRDLVVMVAGDQEGLDADRQRLLQAGAGALRTVLFGGMPDILTAEPHLVFCPDGALNKLPLALVVDMAGDRTDTDRSYRAGVVVPRVPSATIFTHLRGSDRTDAVSVRRLLAMAGGGRSEEQPLAAAAREVAWLAKHFAGVSGVMPDSAARTANFASFDLVHLASHTSVSDEFPWRSTIWARTLGGEGRLISAAEIARSDNSASLTVLANCESAGGRVVTGEGVMGLSSAFIGAGSPTVVASLWPVDDGATYVFMREFYGGLADGANVTQALGRAQDKLARTPRYADPYFRTGFVVIGDGDRTFYLKYRYGLERWQLSLSGGLFLLFTAAVLARRRSRDKFS